MIKLIALVDADLGISKNGEIPWSFREDRKFFRKKTMGSVVVMGRNTFLSIGGIPLDGRINCVISGRGVLATGVEKFTSLEEVMKKYDDFWIIGGAELYNCALERELVDYALITRIRQGYGADTFFSKSALERFSSRVLYENSEYSIVEYL